MTAHTAYAVLRDGKPTGDVIYAKNKADALASACELYTPSRVSVRALA